MNRKLLRTLPILAAASLIAACSKEPAPAKPAAQAPASSAPVAEPKKEESARPMPPSAPTAAPAEGEKK